MYGIYIHIPFCAQKCSYCDFLSYPVRDENKQARYIEALVRELEWRVTEEWQQPVSIFIGGGTPTVLSATLLEKLFEGIQRVVDVAKVAEFTVEANPGTVNKEKMQVLKTGGVNRLSFGVQSFNAHFLQLLGRIHTREDVIQAIAMARACGIDNINLDLMYGLPMMTQAHWQETLQQAVALAPNHLSLYQLIVEPHTKIAQLLENRQLPAMDDDLAAWQFDWQRSWLAEQGYHQYEISNYAQQGKASVHNTLYWQLDDYLGIGLGATGWQRPTRITNTHQFEKYLQALLDENQLPPQVVEMMDIETQMSDSAFMGLRMNEGIDVVQFECLYNRSFMSAFDKAVEEGVQKGWLIFEAPFLCLTDEGRRVGNWVFELFL